MNVFVGYPRDLFGNSSHYGDKDKSVCQCCLFPRNCFLAKYLSGRTIELDKVNELEHDDQSSAASEMVSEVATKIMAPMSTKCYSHGDQSTY